MVKKTATYKAMMDELQSLLAELQDSGLDVDDSLAKYQRGQKLLEQLQAYLRDARNTVEQYTVAETE